ncbi:MAG: ABC transporter permease [Terracidiphilus sp.]
MAGLLQDVRFALRQLRKSPGFAITAVLMLALGICANSTVFSWINGTMLHPVPGARNTGDLVTVMRGTWNDSPSPPLSYPDYRDLREMNHSFTGMLAYNHDWIALTGGTEIPQRVYVSNVSANYFDVLGIQPFMGRFFRPNEEATQSSIPYVILSYSLWQTRFDSDPEIVGKSIEIAQHAVTVIGVAPKGFIGCMPGIQEDMWLTLDPIGNSGRMRSRSDSWLNVMGRLRPGVSRDHATQDLEGLMHHLVAAYPNDHLGVNTITLDPLWRAPFGANGYMAASLPILLAIAGVVLLLTCANVATLALVRFVARRRDIAIRQSLGANQFALMRQMILEGLLVSLAGGALALLLTSWSAKMFARFIPPNSISIALNGMFDGNVVAAILVLSVVASVLCGALPAWRSSHVPASEVLKDEAASVSGGAHHRHLLSGLVVAQIALSLALLIAAGLFLRTLRSISEANPGFEQFHVLTASVGLGIAGYSQADTLAIRHQILDRIAALPGISAVSLTDWVPFNYNRKTADAYPEGYVPQPHESLEVRRAEVSYGYFATLGIPLVEGRDFTRDDNETAPRVVILDQTAANHYWPHQDPIGRKLKIWGDPFTVVGVVKNSKHQRMNEPLEPIIYLSYFQDSDSETVIQVQTSGDPVSAVPALERTVHQINSRMPVFDVRPLSETTQISALFQRIEATFASAFAVLALILATTGIYGVVAYRTQLRTQEIGIRVALGASRSDVLKLVLFQGLRLTAAGLALGLAFSFVLTRFLRGMLYGVSANDPFTAACVTALLAVIAVLACYLPALKAMRINPVNAIRAK